MKRDHLLIFCLALGLLWACTPRRVAPSPERGLQPASTEASTRTVLPYRASEPVHWDLLHTKAEVSFDWENRRMNGEAWLRIKPHFFPKSVILLDAKGFDLHHVELIYDSGKRVEPDYAYDLERIKIPVAATLLPQQELVVHIRYTARPHELDGLITPNAAAEQGLYFINHDGAIADKPRQIWTQGESHGTSGWLPTFDQPNQRCTQEILMTVADSMTTLSNGLLIRSTPNGDGTRTDHWKMSLPHAPYLFMMAVGEFAVVRDEWRGHEVSYYVEPAYEPYARDIFGKTPAMLEYFSNLLGVEYPWEKYAQVVVRDFVSGAMENTSATIHMESLQQTRQEMLDGDFEDYVSHELFHQWFGDLVTCESWANLTLNEGFATYGEYLWKSHHHGIDAGLRHLYGDRRAYLRNDESELHPLIHYHYGSPDEMFDSHSYQKGGQVLHLLRAAVGDDVFFAAVRHYLNVHAFSAVEVDELRMAFEYVTGEDMHWFFDPWFMEKGHPILDVTVVEAGNQTEIRIRQVQPLDQPVFAFPTRLVYEANGSAGSLDVMVHTADTSFLLPVPMSGLSFVDVDADRVLPGEIRFERSQAMLRKALEVGNYIQRVQAMDGLDMSLPENRKAVIRHLEAPFWGDRQHALRVLESYEGGDRSDFAGPILKLTSDSKAGVRGEAFDWLLSNALLVRKDEALAARTKAAVRQGLRDSSLQVQSSAMMALQAYDPPAALSLADSLAPIATGSQLYTVKEIYRALAPRKAIEFVSSKLSTEPSARNRLGLIAGLGEMAEKQEKEMTQDILGVLMETAEKDSSWWVRFSAGRQLTPFMKHPNVKDFVERRAQEEPHPTVKNMYQAMMGE